MGLQLVSWLSTTARRREGQVCLSDEMFVVGNQSRVFAYLAPRITARITASQHSLWTLAVNMCMVRSGDNARPMEAGVCISNLRVLTCRETPRAEICLQLQKLAVSVAAESTMQHVVTQL